MYSPVARALIRASARSPVSRVASRVPRRFASTSSSSSSSSSWRGFAVRLGLVGGAVYYYNTSPLFAEESAYALPMSPPETRAPEPVRTLESIAEEKKARLAAAETVVPVPEPASPEELEEEAESQGAFNPETGEINWDCPCLGGMAHGPCGEEFKAAFSCFVYSTDEPKGMDCIEKFKGMQDCFRQYPDVYGAELEDAEGGEDTEVAEIVTSQQEDVNLQNENLSEQPHPIDTTVGQSTVNKVDTAKAASNQVKSDFEPLSESDTAVPRAQLDTRDDNADRKDSEKK